MARRKRRPFTPRERQEVRDLCRRGKFGNLGAGDADRCQDLFRINGPEYGELAREASRDAAEEYMDAFRGGRDGNDD